MLIQIIFFTQTISLPTIDTNEKSEFKDFTCFFSITSERVHLVEQKYL